MAKSKYFYDYTRNMPCDEMLETDSKVPAYYVGRNGMMAKDVIYEFDLSYNVGTCVTYCLRSKRKHKDGGIQDLKKAIAHLQFELEQLENSK
jgi:hypothetical protein|tara:strand:+ start:6282 stop:6557 length:276 start_codon:yes stop_codon:yes gene_type:complete